MASPPGPKPRRRWLRWLGAVLLLVVGVIGFTALRLWWQHRQHHELREAEVGRAPVVAPRTNRSVKQPLPSGTPRGTTCLQGFVRDGRTASPVAGMQVSLPPLDRKRLGPCSDLCDAERLAQLLLDPRLGLLEPEQSTTSGADGRFLLCGVSDLPAIVFGEHADGRFAVPLDTWPPIQPGVDVALTVPALLPVTGIVRTTDGRPVKGRLLIYPHPSLIVRDVASDDSGRFTAQLPPGSVTAVVAREGRPPVAVSGFVGHRQPLVLTLSEPFTLTVRALSKGQPVQGAEVIVGGGAAQLTDAKGETTLTVISEQQQQNIVVTKGELVGRVHRYGQLEGRVRVDVDLVPGVRVKGSVIDEKGQGRIGEVSGLPGGRVETDANGHFVSAGFADDTVHLQATVEGCSSGNSTVEAEPGTPVLLEVRCEPTLTGMVLDAEGNPLAKATVSVQGADYEGLVTATDGRFALHVPKGAYQLDVEHHDYRSEHRPITVPAKDVAVVLDAGGSIAGRVVDEKGQPIASAEVTVFPGVIDELLREAEDGAHARDTTAEDGTFRLKGLLAGRWIIVVDGASLPPTPSEPLVLQPGENKEGVVVKVGGTVDLSGTVVDDQRRPIPGARVKWAPTDEKAALTSVLVDVVAGRLEEVVRFLPADILTDVEGRFEVKNVQVKAITVSVYASGYDEAEVKTTRGSTVDVVLREKTKGKVKGHVVDEVGRAVTRFEVNGEHYANEPGEFEVDANEGKTYLRLSAPGFSSKNLEFEFKGPLHDLGAVTLVRGVTLTVKVLQEDGKPLERARAFAKQADSTESCSTKADGVCGIGALRDEATTVTVAHSGFLEKTVEVGKGRLSERLEVVLSAAGGRAEGVVFAAPGRPAIARRVTVTATADNDFAVTDENGHFSATGLPEGPGCVTFELSGLLGTEWSVPLTLSKTPTPVTVGPMAGGAVLVTKSTLPGRVVLLGGAGSPLKATDVGTGSVSSLCTEKRAPAISYVSTGESRLEGVPPGKWSVYLIAITELDEAKEIAPVIVDLAPGETKRVP